MLRQQMSRIDTPRSQASGDDRLEIKMKPHPFIFSQDPKNPLNEQIVETINRMGGVGEDAEKRYQSCLNALFRQAREVVAIVAQELRDQPADAYLDRWSLVHLLSELKQPAALGALDAILSARIPEERYKDPHNFTSVGEEVVIRTTAIDAITRIAADGEKEAQEMLLKHVRHDNFSIKRAAVQGYLQVAGEGGRETLRKNMQESDHHILDIKVIDVRQAPQAEGGLYLKPCDREDLPALGSESDLGGKDLAGKSDKGCGCK